MRNQRFGPRAHARSDSEHEGTRRHHPEGLGGRDGLGGHEGLGGREGPGGLAGGMRGHRGRGRGLRGEIHGRGRAQRGDVRAATLLLLAETPMHGYQLMQAITDRTQGAWRPSPGAIYPTIAQLEDEGLVTVVPEAGRKLVTLTDAGRAYLEDNRTTLADPFTAITMESGGRLDLRGSVADIFRAARAVTQSGTDTQIAAAQEILNQTRRSLYLILADGADRATSSEDTSE